MPLEAFDLALSLHQLGVSPNGLLIQHRIPLSEINIVAVCRAVKGIANQKLPYFFHVAQPYIKVDRPGRLVLQFKVQRGALVLAIDVILRIEIAHLVKQRLPDNGYEGIRSLPASQQHIGFPGNVFHHTRRVVSACHNAGHFLGKALEGRQVIHQLPLLLREGQDHVRHQYAFDIRSGRIDQ